MNPADTLDFLRGLVARIERQAAEAAASIPNDPKFDADVLEIEMRANHHRNHIAAVIGIIKENSK